jgi:hypothetical protein
MEKHVTLLGILYITLNFITLFAAVIVIIVFAGSAVLSGDEEAVTILSIVGSAIVIFLLILSVPGIIGGIGLLQKREWARILVIILAVFNLFNIPLGTALGIYSFWVLLHQDTTPLFKPTNMGGD